MAGEDGDAADLASVEKRLDKAARTAKSGDPQARLEQRVGRAARIGSRHDRVAVYAMQAPASAERLVRVEERLRAIDAPRVLVGGEDAANEEFQDQAQADLERGEGLALPVGR